MYPSNNIAAIDRQIADLNDMKARLYQPFNQVSPVQNIINTNQNHVDLEGRILKDGENASDVIVNNRTIFISESQKEVVIKEVDGTISKRYELIIPKTEEQLKIEQLEQNNFLLQKRLNEMEEMLNGAKYSIPIQSVEAEQQSDAISDGNAKSSTKKSSK